MKRLLLLAAILMFCQMLHAQKQRAQNQVLTDTKNQQHLLNATHQGPRCATDVFLQQSFNKYPYYQTTIKRANLLLNREVNRRIDLVLQKKNIAESSIPVVIPVVIHIVLPDPSVITDAMVDYQLKKLNADFSGFNPDSTNLSPAFPYSLRGHSNIQFTLAKKDPRNNFTSGIERRCSNTKFTTANREPLKLATEGGLDAWNPDKYLNIWVGNTDVDGVLGFSTYPYSVAGYEEPPAAFRGIVIKQQAFANNTSLYAFNRGRTLVHEMGHFFGLFHIFQGGCMNQDFSLASFDAGNEDDTPPQTGATGYEGGGQSSCPSGIVSSGCSATPNGRLYQNYMDYTDDPCMNMFTKNQVIRMEAALDLFKAGLKSSDAGIAPPVFTRDLQVLATLGPDAGDPSFLDCNASLSKLSYCSNEGQLFIQPQLKIRNVGSAAVTTFEIWYKVGNSAPVLNRKFLPGDSIGNMAIASVQLQPIQLVSGDYDLQIFTVGPDNMADENQSNDTIHLPVSVELASTQPVMESFEGPDFPPAGWKRVDQDLDNFTWQKADGVQKSGKASVFMNFFDYDHPGRVDDLISPAMDIAFADSILLDFERAYKQFDTTVKDFSDTLEILVSEDCGQHFNTIWKNGGAALASTAGATGLFSWFPSDSDWLKTSIDLRPYVSKSASAIRVIFRAKNGYGQNLFLDDISIRAVVKPIRDAGIVNISEPTSRICNGNFTPTVLIENLGEDTLRKLTLNYSIDGGSLTTLNWTGRLKKFQQQAVAFEPTVLGAKGLHQIIFSIGSPNGVQDQNLENDTIKWRVMFFDATNAPLTEGFETSVFPPMGWDIAGSDDTVKWQRTFTASSEKLAAAWVNNRMNTSTGSREELYSPIIKVGNMDSLLVTFDLAHVTEQYPGAGRATDTLQVLLTTDCGKTFTTVYKKWGFHLNTLKEAYPGMSTRDSIGFQPHLKSQWRTDSINITKALGVSKQFQLVFRNVNNNDNNVFLDNIKVNPVILSDRLKEKGYQLMPNPTTGLFYVRHYSPPLNLEGIQVVNASGQLILTQQYKGNASSTIPVDLRKEAPGVYTVRLMYNDKTITEKIIKLH